MKAFKITWLPAPIIFFLSFSLLLTLSILISSKKVNAREEFQFQLGNKVQILSDKAFRRSKENLFEAVGNVIITQQQNAIYGEKASLSFATGETEVLGNVRYVAPNITMHGSQLNYNFNSQFLSIYNARILTDSYVLLGKLIERPNSETILAKDAEYSTCRDCPESWSIFGRDVHITIGEYVRITHAYIKVKGVVIMYVPYIVLPIKKKRETGLLPPSLGFGQSDGAGFQLPFFWAISDSTDMTITPQFIGKRGMANELEYRQVLKDGFWFEFGGLQLKDNNYNPYENNNGNYDDSSRSSQFRHFSEWEHHYSSNQYINHHVYYNFVNDMDMAKNFSSYTGNRITGTEYGGGGFLEFNYDYFSISSESYFNRNNLFDNAKGFDHRYVQILPKINFEITPIYLLQYDLPVFNKLILNFDGDYTIFKQNHIEEGDKIRNAERINISPSLEWNFGRLGPIMGSTKATLDYQHYRFPTRKNTPTYTKSGFVHETEFFFEIEKLFGLSYKQDYPAEQVINLENIKLKEQENEKDKIDKTDLYIGKLPSNNIDSNEKVTISRNSYRHAQIFKLKHYYLTSQKRKGYAPFEDQIASATGQFDNLDAVREKQTLFDNDASKTELPFSNTLELQWNNSFIRKSSNGSGILKDDRSIRDNFSFEKITWFNISQGYDYNKNSGKSFEEKMRKYYKDNLTRLFIETGLNFKDITLSASEYYYYSTQGSIFSLGLTKNFSRLSLGLNFTYNSFSTPIAKKITLNTSSQLNDLFYLAFSWTYNMNEKASERTQYGLVYTPHNRCWRLDLTHDKTILEDRFSFNLALNFDGSGFRSLSDQE